MVEGTPLFSNDAPSDIFLFQLPNPLLQELPPWFLLGHLEGGVGVTQGAAVNPIWA